MKAARIISTMTLDDGMTIVVSRPTIGNHVTGFFNMMRYRIRKALSI